VYQRGPAVADGGETASEQSTEQMKDIDHTPPHGESANEVWERGNEETPDVPEDDVDE
jgi:hypothetical protein